MRRYEWVKTVVMFFLFLSALPPAFAAGTLTYTVTVNTAPLAGHPAGPFSILFAFTDGSGLADSNNTVSVSNVDFGGGNGLGGATLFGGANGTLESGVIMTDAYPLSLFSEAFSPGQVLRFTLTLTTNDDDGGIPDRISFYILDASGKTIATLSPAADYLLGADLGSVLAQPAAFGTDPTRSPFTGNPIAIGAPTVTSNTTRPVTAASLSPLPNANGWNNTNVTVTLSSSGNTSVKQITYSASGAQLISSMTVGSATVSFLISVQGITTITFFGSDNAGNVETAKSLTIKLDETPPSISCGAADGLWHATDVSIACSASDAGSGLVISSDGSFLLGTTVPAGTETTTASTGAHSVCDVAGNCSTAGPVGGNMVDKKAPSISVTTPINASYLLNQAVTAGYGCSDGGSGVATCTGTVASGARVDTSSVGNKKFTINATDNVGNTSSPQSVSYSVTYGLCLLYDPTRSVQGGSTIPLKLQLCDAGNNDVSNSSAVLHATNLAQTGANASQLIQSSGNANPDNDFRFDPTLGPTGGYIFNLSTKGLATGSYSLSFTAGSDPVTHMLAFQVR